MSDRIENAVRAYRIGDNVTVPDDYCPGCMAHTGPMSGLIVGYEKTSKLEDEGLSGPYYLVDVNHEHNAGGRLVYDESELTPAT